MQRLISGLLSLIVSSGLFSQNDTNWVKIKPSHSANYGIKHLGTEIVVNSNVDLQDLILASTNGKIIRVDDSTYYFTSDKSYPKIQFYKSHISDSILIEEVDFHFLEAPLPLASIGGKWSTDSVISQKRLRNTMGIRAQFINHDIDLPLTVSSFDIELILKNGEYLRLENQRGNKFTSQVKALFNKGVDRIIVSRIMCQLTNEEVELFPIILTVTSE